MEYSLIGRTGLRVSKVALGTALLGVSPLEDDCRPLIKAALDGGINLFDCANTYGSRAGFDRPGVPPASLRSHAEEILGRALKGIRDEIVLCTKVAEPVGTGVNDGGYGEEPGRGGGLSRYHLIREVERSLSRLGSDHVDICHFHLADPDTRIEDSLAAAEDLIRQGKVRYVALSNFAGWQMTEAWLKARHLRLSEPILNQVPYNLINRSVEAEVVPAAEAAGMAISCYSPLAGGALAGSAVMDREFSGDKRWGDDGGYSNRARKISEGLESLALAWGAAPSHVALRWLLSRKAVATAIIGPESPAELAQSLGAFDLELSAEQLDALDELSKVSD